MSRSCPTLCSPMDCSMLGFPVLHFLLEFTQTYVHCVNDAIQTSHPLSPPSLPALSLSQHQSFFFFPVSQLFLSGGQSIGASTSASVLPMNIQDWFPLGWTGLFSLQSKGLSRVFFQHHSSKASILQHSAFFIVQVTSVPDYRKNHSFDYMDRKHVCVCVCV